MAEVINYHYQDHSLSKTQTREVCQQFRFMAIQLSQIDSLYDLKLVYKAITIFSHHMAEFQHRDRNYSIEKEVRQGILERLSNCIATENNFQRRLSFMNSNQNSNNRDSQNLIFSW